MSEYLSLPALKIEPVVAPLMGSAVLPGSKSITNRALLLAGLAKGRSKVSGALKSDDTKHMANALRAMGVEVDEPNETTFMVQSSGRLSTPAESLFLGNAGTATRFLTAAVVTVEGEVIVDGDQHMQKRPIQPLVEALASAGVTIHAPTGCPPVTVNGDGSFPAGRIEIDGGLSSQYVSALLMAAPMAKEGVEIALTGTDIGAKGYIDLTVAAMSAFGATVEFNGIGVWRIEPSGYSAADFQVEPDASAATYLWAAAAITNGEIDIGCVPTSFTQPDARAYEAIAAFPHMPEVIDGSQMQDAIPTLAVLSAYNNRPVRFVGIENLRVKECDRITALSEGLNRIKRGLATEEGDDLVVNSDPTLRGREAFAEIATFADHRIAMSFSLAGLITPGITILDPGCVAKTFPSYWDTLERLGVRFSQ
ncbi:MAG: 3-phosphoshikimate 1-carboxyvinyltransferase [Pseudomonadota bacterium]